MKSRKAEWNTKLTKSVIAVDGFVHHKLKVYCAKNGLTIAKVTETAILQYIK